MLHPAEYSFVTEGVIEAVAIGCFAEVGLWCHQQGAETVATAPLHILLASFPVTLSLSVLKTGIDLVFDQQPFSRTLGLLPHQFQIRFPTACYYH